MSDSEIKYIISLVLDDAYNALSEYKKSEGDDFYKGRVFSYYEVLLTLKNQLDARVDDLKDYGLDIDLEKTFIVK